MDDYQLPLVDNTYLKDFNLKSRSNEDDDFFRFFYDGKTGLHAGIKQMPWNCSLILFYGFEILGGVDDKLFNEIFNSLFNAIKPALIEDEYTKILYTTSGDQRQLINSLKYCGFKQIDNYSSVKNGHHITIWVYELEHTDNDDDDYDDEW